ncbi:MAG: GNAT family N-acetyltransferase [Armatimonadota bacterium]
MKIVRFPDACDFYQAVAPLLLERETENNLMLGIAARLADGSGKWSDEPPLLCSVEEDDRAIAAVLQTPPHYPIFTRTEPMIVDLLAAYLHKEVFRLPGVLGPVATVESFVKAWMARTGVKAQSAMSQRIYQLEQVAITPDTPGQNEEAVKQDFETLLPWMRAFMTATGVSAADQAANLQQQIEQHQVYLWKNPQPVSMAACCGPTPHGIRISGVYTPRKYRNHGYATANVAALSQRLLDSGCQYCFLFTDLANPVSNSIYQKIGYQPVCDFAAYQFVQNNPLKQHPWIYGTKRRKWVSDK